MKHEKKHTKTQNTRKQPDRIHNEIFGMFTQYGKQLSPENYQVKINPKQGTKQ